MFKYEVLNFYGSGIAIAKVLSISSSAVSQWPDIIPEKQAYRLEYLTNGLLKVNQEHYQKNGNNQSFLKTA